MRYITLLVICMSLASAGCQINQDSSLDANSGQSNIVNQSCQNNDYEITELALNSTHPILSHSYEVNIKISRRGDCINKVISIALYDGDQLVSRVDREGLDEIIETVIKWSPLIDDKRTLTARIETTDDNQENNEEQIIIDVAPIGNYQNLKYLSSDPVDVGLWKAHAFEVKNPITVKKASAYFRKYSGDNNLVNIIAQIRTDNQGSPGKLLQETEIPAQVTNAFDWYNFDFDLDLEQGRYWLILSLSSLGNLNWHFSSNPPYGTEDDSLGMRLNFDELTQTWQPTEWVINSDRDYSFKISGVETGE